MAKSIINQRYIYKNHSSRFRDMDWDLNLDIKTAKKNNEIVSINDSIALRILRHITNNSISEKEIQDIKHEIKKLKKESYSKSNTQEIKQLYNQLDDMLVIQELNSIVFDLISDWNYITSKKKISLLNNKRIKRIIGTSGGVKKSTVLFSDSKIHDEFNDKLNNGISFDKKYVPAKFEAYKALAFSGSTPVTQPKGVLVIKDGEIDTISDILLLSDDEKGGFKLEKKENYKIKRAFCDGCGMISRQLSEQWTIDMGCYTYDNKKNKVANYISSGFNIRNAWCKGMVFNFPYLEFTEEIAIPSGKSYFVEDAWGHMVDIRNVDLIITTNMLKLWDAYDSIDHYLECCQENGFEFCVAKILPEELENTRNMNYQFLESYDLSDKDIQELIKPTVDSIKGAISEDYLKMLLFLKGYKISKSDYLNEEYDYLKALMIDKRMMDDPFIKQRVYHMIEKKINDSKKGVLEVEGSYHIVSGDLYGLCEYMYGLEVTGLLKANEFYAKSWLDKGVNKIVSYRAPMTVHNNIKVMPLVNNKQTEKWYRFMKTCLIINAWDTTMEAMNGQDFDGDANITTNNPVLLQNTHDALAIICEQNAVEKQKITESSLKKANKNGFNNDVGGVTNRCTSIYDVLAKFEKDSKEYKEMMYRIICMQGYQQEVIDSIKGIIPKRVPKHWYNYKTIKFKDSDTEEEKKWKEYQQKLLSNKNPYFFIYNYKNLMKRYKRYKKNNNTNCLIKYGLTVEELKQKKYKSEKELEFLKYYDLMMPVSIEHSVMNRICWALEHAYMDLKVKINGGDFDYSILKSNIKYNIKDKQALEMIYKRYGKDMRIHNATYKDSLKSEKNDNRKILLERYKKEIYSICNNEKIVCEILLDLCYRSNNGKQFVWDMCGDVIINNLLEQNNYKINIPIVTSEVTDTCWSGKYYKLETADIKER